jgi:hypothetical protein
MRCQNSTTAPLQALRRDEPVMTLSQSRKSLMHKDFSLPFV